MTPRPEHRRSLRDLPKAHLHLHLVGAMRLDTLESLGRKAGLAVDLATYFEGFDHFDETYMIANSAIRTADDLTRLILEVLEDAKADGAVWVEPTLYLDSFKDVIGPGELVLEIATDALKSARDQVGIGAALIVPAQRGMGPDDAVRQARLALRGDPDVVRAYGLVGIGRDRSIDGFGEALGIASSGGLALTPHAGEYSGGVSGAWGPKPGRVGARRGRGSHSARHRRCRGCGVDGAPRRSSGLPRRVSDEQRFARGRRVTGGPSTSYSAGTGHSDQSLGRRPPALFVLAVERVRAGSPRICVG